MDPREYRLVDFSDYQQKAEETAVYPLASTGRTPAVVYTALGLAGEAGEVANTIKKVLRDNDGELTEEKALEVAKELGDVLWYLSRLATEIGFPLFHVAELNLEKLQSRKQRNTLHGSGGDR